ncbi:uncharacterized protein LOC125720446 [Brienomyrus brachyistius]|uniref:uncharacterized protein LOC125720446 n=1 Tax=Brienomyrus brachyistius TaxID=42636 RepID=UPI0020B2C23F|nr:uncharacterized protein LOC125720446 [Brienomyrus brachyistius]XP_048851853.1 uncharacterized protein LOC125720446 [Brienomyrus brachyistius]XP_048851855.1 uncharacterized protein LOC125720446 [Brienomyrus brachyistius]
MGIHSPSRKVPTLNSVQDLSGVTFGHKFPKHGLKLLHWLANEWIEFDDERQMMAMTDPRTREFGFHIFHNKENILPLLFGDQSWYFEVGNLHADGAEDLPFNEANTGSDKSNTDRIIVRMDSSQVVGEVYITEHTPHHNSFSSESTYRISRGLIQHLQNLEENVFLQRAGYIPRKNESPRSESRETTVKILRKNESPRSESRETTVKIPRKNESPRSESRETTVKIEDEDFPRRSSSTWDSVCNCVIL